MLIQVVNVSTEDRGKYTQMKVAYRSNGKLGEKTLMSFGASVPAFEVLKTAEENSWFEVTTAKNAKGFWDWTAAVPASQTTATPAVAAGNSTPQRTFETAEERAARQVLIVRQSSISSAIEFHKLNSKKVPTTGEVLEVAEAFVNYVFQKDPRPEAGIFEMEDDLPF